MPSLPNLPSMPKIGNIAFAGGTVAIAMVAGFFMQAGSFDRAEPKQVAFLEPSAVASNPVAPSRVVKSDAASVSENTPKKPKTANLMTAGLDLGSSVADKVAGQSNLIDKAATSAEVNDERLALASVEDDRSSPLPALKDPVLPVDCQASLKAESTAAAMVQLEFRAPCNVGERVTVHHNGMMFTEVTDGSGRLSIKVPALAENALFMVSLATGKTLVANTKVSSLEFYDRALVQWKGETGLQIHALEFGADYGEEGHLWAENAGSIQRIVSGESGFITRYGDPSSPDALFAEVYTYPTLTSKQEGTIELSVEAEVVDGSCDKEIAAQSIQYTSGKKLRVQDLSLQMPACDSYGGYLVLKNLLEDLTIAHR